MVKPSPLTSRQVKGALAEQEVVGYIKNQGYTILSRNWMSGRDEIDIVAKDGKCIVFIEVRARSIKATVSGYHTVESKKKKALLRVCGAYLRLLKKMPLHFRFDIAEVRLGPMHKNVINYYQNVNLFPKYFGLSNHASK